MADKILLENGVDRLLLEDGTSFLLLEGASAAVVLRHPVFSIQQKKKLVLSGIAPNLLTTTLKAQTVTGTVNVTDTTDTSAISGSPIVVGTLTRTNANDTSAASGTPVTIGTLAATNNNDTSAVSGSPIVVGSLARSNNNDTSSASGSPIVSGTTNYTNSNDTISASGTAGAAPLPFTPVVFTSVYRRSINPIVYGSRGINPQPPVVPSAPVRPDVFVTALRKPNRFTSFDFPNLLNTVFAPQQIASSYPENVTILRKQLNGFTVFPNLVIRIPLTSVSGTITSTNSNDTSAGSGTPIINGTISTTNINDSISASGEIGQAVSGTISSTNNNDTVSASGSPIANGVVAYTEFFDVSAISGSPVVVGSINKTNNNDNMSASGIVGPIIAGAGTKLPLTGVGT